MAYEFDIGSLPGRKNYDSGEYEVSVLETEPVLNALPRYPNTRGNDSVVIQGATVPIVENGQIHNYHVPMPANRCFW